MYLPALEAGLLRDSAGRLRDPLPGPAGVTEVMREARVQSGSKVLEVAATLGYVAMVAARIVGSTGEARVAQLDPALLAAARAHVAAHGLSHAVQIACVGTEVVPYPTGTFDAVISDRALCCLYTRPESQQRLLDEMARVMRPGGRLVVVEAVPVGAAKPGESSLPECIQGSMFVREPDRFVAMLRRSGFERIGITRIPNTRMATESMCETVGIPFSDEHMEFALISATKAGQARREARRGDPDGAARGSLGSDGRCTC
jgi:SAM-dependent methyltransferase